MKSIMDEFVTYRLHEEDVKRLPSSVKTIMNEHLQISFYPDGKKNGKNFDKVVELKRVIKQYVSIVKKHKGDESNEEGMCVDAITQLLSTMMLADIRKLKLENLLRKKNVKTKI